MTPQGIQTASQILMEYQDLMKNLGFDQPHVFATASLRNISNTEDAVAQLQRDTRPVPWMCCLERRRPVSPTWGLSAPLGLTAACSSTWAAAPPS